jgi:hypothetical protein
MAEHRDLQVARISARQAIIVASITAMAGLAGGYLARPPSAPDGRQYRLHIVRINTDGAEAAVRIVVDVDGQAYSYPSRALWADVVPNMSSEDFPLPAGKSEYRVRFSAFVRRADGTLGEAVSQEAHVVPVSAVPLRREYRLYPLDAGFTRSARGEGFLGLTVHYEVR